MYCSTCGTLLDTKLNYCNRCGARIEKLATAENTSSSQNLSIGLGFVGLGGLGLTVGLIAILLNKNVVIEAVVILAMLFLATIFGITFLMIRQLSRMKMPATGEQISEKPNLVQLGATNTAQLEEYRQPAQSVTENTTRTLEEVSLKRN